jgi:hypothetical protein
MLGYLFFFIKGYGAYGASKKKTGSRTGSGMVQHWRRKVRSCWKMFPNHPGASGALVQI